MTNVIETGFTRFDNCRARTDNNGHVAILMELDTLEYEEDLKARRRFEAWKRRQR